MGSTLVHLVSNRRIQIMTSSQQNVKSASGQPLAPGQCNTEAQSESRYRGRKGALVYIGIICAGLVILGIALVIHESTKGSGQVSVSTVSTAVATVAPENGTVISDPTTPAVTTVPTVTATEITGIVDDISPEIPVQNATVIKSTVKPIAKATVAPIDAIAEVVTKSVTSVPNE